MNSVTEEQIDYIGDVLNNPKRPLKERFRALFCLRNLGGVASIKHIQRAFSDTSALLKHELAYCLGQMQDERANLVLKEVLQDLNQEAIVRHEAAEALGAIGSRQSVELLEKYKSDKAVEVAQTCELALERINWLHRKNDKEKSSENPFMSIDPAPPTITENIADLKATLLNNEVSLFQRYRAMFCLRNLKSDEAAMVLGLALKCDGALFKHEVAFVLGQLQNELSVPALKEKLEDRFESGMVRHECAEALGAIANDECIDILKKYVNDENRLVKESCEIALDMCEYENSFDFQYANTIDTFHSNHI
ncbi:hypothetical protein NQ317_016955 [Molorchus minor]|uniref:Deoxyhypusine hydroxylase n=1 Tax=Molorchus minor TaxID=1323400 RepID=A0ABQ9K5A0_9CUCU|nr:hypothetical protein NQ317_016955 [Molorchus minor]